MGSESFKAENSDEIVRLRLNRLKSTQLCEKLIRRKLETSGITLSEDVIISKSVGLSSAIESALGFWEYSGKSLNSRILSNYYFLMQMTIAEQVASVANVYDLQVAERHTEQGHGLAIVDNPNVEIPNNILIVALKGGHFYQYTKFLDIDVKPFAFDKKPRDFAQVQEPEKLVRITDLLRRIPELSKVVSEHLGLPPLVFHVGYGSQNDRVRRDATRKHLDETGELVFDVPNTSDYKTSFVNIYPESQDVTLEYLQTLNLPFQNLELEKDTFSNRDHIVGALVHPSNLIWHEYIRAYNSSYSTLSYVHPLWNNVKDDILINYMLLYVLSIIVRYMPNFWYRVHTGNLNHIGSLLEYYISVISHVLPLRMLERITGSKIAIHQPGSFFGQI